MEVKETGTKTKLIHFINMARTLDSCELERWAILAWSIWNARNKFYFEQNQVHPNLILSGAYRLLDEFQRLMQSRVYGAHGFGSYFLCGAWGRGFYFF